MPLTGEVDRDGCNDEKSAGDDARLAELGEPGRERAEPTLPSLVTGETVREDAREDAREVARELDIEPPVESLS